MRRLDPDVIRKRRKRLNHRNWPSERWFEKNLKKLGIEGYRRNWCLEEKYFGDFVWIHLKLVIEIDGSSHDNSEQKEYNQKRDLILQECGWNVIRVPFKDSEKFKEVTGILQGYDRKILNYSGLERKKRDTSGLTGVQKFLLARSSKFRENLIKFEEGEKFVRDSSKLHKEILEQKEILRNKTQVVWIKGVRRVVVMA